MCFAKTKYFCLLQEIEEILFNNMEKAQYGAGCIPISCVAANVLQSRGYRAKVTLVAAKKLTLAKNGYRWVNIPHFVVLLDGDILDLKRRIFSNSDKVVNCEPQIEGYFATQPNWKGSSYYDINPTAKLFFGPERVKFFEFKRILKNGNPESGWKELYNKLLRLINTKLTKQ